MGSYYITLLLLVVPAIVSGIQQEITFYTEVDQGGNSVTLKSSQPDLSGYSGVMNFTKSYCVTGEWNIFGQKNYVGEYLYGWGTIVEGVNCGNFNMTFTPNSIRHWAAPDTTTLALSIYEGLHMSGRELFITLGAQADLPFSPQSFASSGKSSWSFYDGPDFSGNSTCMPAGNYNMNFEIDISPNNFSSVVRGCNLEAERNIELYRNSVLF